MPTPLIASVAIRRLILPDIRVNHRPRVTRLTIVPEDGSAGPVYIPYSPTEIEHSGLGGEFAKVGRAGRKDALVYLREQLPVMSFTLFVADRVIRQDSGFQVRQSLMLTVSALQNYASKGTRLKIQYGSLETGTWRITSFAVKSARRDPYNDEIKEADIDIEFTRVSDIVVGVGPVTGGVQPPPQTTPPASQPSRIYIVKKGDTLYAISIKYYGTGVHWGRIADANGIKDPRKLQIGTKLRIP